MTAIIGTISEAVSAGRRRRFDEGNFHGVADYLFETAPGESLGPQALIARQAPGWTLPVHFHMQHQFQVVLSGGGTLGKHTLMPGSAHYTSPQSAYGPIVAGPEGLDYFTLRVLTDKGAWYMPESREVMKIGMFKEQKWGSAQSSEAPIETLIELRDDGLGAWAYRPGKGHAIMFDMAPGKAGWFLCVIDGSFRIDSREALAAGTCAYCFAGETPEVVADTEEAFLVVVQFPEASLDNDVPTHLRMAPSARGVPLS